jgi:hypothetical protein
MLRMLALRSPLAAPVDRRGHPIPMTFGLSIQLFRIVTI